MMSGGHPNFLTVSSVPLQKGGHLDLKGIVVVVYRHVDPREPDDFMQPVATLVDHSETGHDASHLVTAVVGLDGQLVDRLRELGEFQVGRHLVGNE
jgi:hypothetical protein